VSEAVVDANILLRLLTGMPPELAARARELFRLALERGIALVLAPMILAEVAYVLSRVYQWPRPSVADGLIELLDTEPLVVLERPVVEQMLGWFREHPSLGLPDAYVAALAVSRGHGNVISFDRDLRRIPAVNLIGAPAAVPPG
jgi:predicted nucleic acid-binding protein